MKAPVVGLVVAATAFGASSLYLWHQLDLERERADQVEATARELNARLVELENARETLMKQRHLANGGGFMSGQFGELQPSKTPPAPAVAAAATAEATERARQGAGNQVWTVQRAEAPPGFQKMMRANLRANNKRMYGDLAAQLGLDKETTGKFIDLLTDHQLAGFNFATESTDPAEMQRQQEQKQREHEAAVAALLGHDKVLALQEYQATMPARHEFEMLARQLEGNDVALSETQRRKMLDLYIEERKRIPMPEYVDGVDGEAYARSINQWQDDYNRRLAAQAGSILNIEQLEAYQQMQQWQKEMREQVSVSLPAGAAGLRPVNRGFAGANTMTFAAPAAVAVAVPVAAPETPPPAKEAPPRQ